MTPTTSRRLAGNAFGAAAGILADRLLGEPQVPDHLHPVALLGTTAAAVERQVYGDSRRRGALYAGAGALGAVAAGRLVRAPAVATYLASSGRALHTAAGEVATALERDDLDLARSLLPRLVGRDPAGLDGNGIARAVVESVAENTTDAIVAPALWSLAAGAPGTFLHRAADTLDSMVGYRDQRYGRFGTATARLDDALAWVPARATALLVAAVRPRQAGEVLATVRADGPAHPSPNAGTAEAAFAAALGLRLGGSNRYGGRVEPRPTLGRGRPPAPADIPAAVALSRDVTRALAGLLAAVGAGAWLRSRGRLRLPGGRGR